MNRNNPNAFVIDLRLNEGPLHQFIKKMIYWMIREKMDNNKDFMDNNKDFTVEWLSKYNKSIRSWEDKMSLLDIFNGRIITKVKMEHKIEKYLIPDIIVGFKSGEKIIIEVVVHGPPSIKKIKKLSDLNYGFYQLSIPSGINMESFYYKQPKDFWKYKAKEIMLSGYSPLSNQIEKLSLNLRVTKWLDNFKMRYVIKSKEFELSLSGSSRNHEHKLVERTDKFTWKKGKFKGLRMAEDLRLFEEIFASACRQNLVGFDNKESLLLTYCCDVFLPKTKILQFQNYFNSCSNIYESSHKESLIKYFAKGGRV